MPLSASMRISLLKEISDRLQVEEWPLIDLTLSQFGLPTPDEWQGNKNGYVIEMSKRAEDSVLVELAQHVGFLIEEAPKPGIDPPFWRKRMFRLFVTHLAIEKVLAAQLQEALLGYGISGFVAHNDIEPTLEWQTQIETALSTADSLVALLHPAFHKSNWTDQEIGFAMGRGLPVFAIRFGQDPYGFIGRFQGFVGGGKTPEVLAGSGDAKHLVTKEALHQKERLNVFGTVSALSAFRSLGMQKFRELALPIAQRVDLNPGNDARRTD